MAKKSKNKVEVREVVDAFASEIKKRKIPTSEKIVIPFRNDKQLNTRRDIFLVPLDLLYFRKDNGRIASDVLTHEVIYGELDEKSDTGQLKLKSFLLEKDREKTTELINSIKLIGQDEAAVITSDGFLINGNRRKLVLQTLLESDPSNENWKYLKVVILPGKKEDEPLPTINEIEQLENRYQMQTLGKAEYYNFDKALSIRRKISHGMSLEEQLKDDPNYASLPLPKFKKELAKFREEYLEPLECIDRYLEYFEKSGQYNTISTKYSDREGRWQAFLDYYKSVYKKLKNPVQRLGLGLQEDEVGIVEDVAFKIIRKRDINGVDKKVHQIMRELPKLLSNPKAKKELFELSNTVSSTISEEDSVNQYVKELDGKTIDTLWDSKYGREIDYYVGKAFDYYQNKKQEETPVKLIKEALNNLIGNQVAEIVLTKQKIKEIIEDLVEIEKRSSAIRSELEQMLKRKRN